MTIDEELEAIHQKWMSESDDRTDEDGMFDAMDEAFIDILRPILEERNRLREYSKDLRLKKVVGSSLKEYEITNLTWDPSNRLIVEIRDELVTSLRLKFGLPRGRP